jgi:hypothetical protein
MLLCAEFRVAGECVLEGISPWLFLGTIEMEDVGERNKGLRIAETEESPRRDGFVAGLTGNPGPKRWLRVNPW